MGKNTKHKKLLKSEKAKVKLRTKGNKNLPKGLNITDTSFKTKKILIQEQFKQQNESEILSRRKLDVKALLTRLQHHNNKVRQEALKELKDILQKFSPERVSSPLQPLLQGILALSLDKEKDIRRESFKVLNLILAQVTTECLLFYSNIIIPYLGCTMTHISPCIREDSLILLDSLINNCSYLIAKNKEKILPNFLDLISRLRKESQPGRQLTVTLGSRNTNIKWTNKVLSNLAKIFNSILKNEKRKNVDSATLKYKDIKVDDDIVHAPLYVNQNITLPCILVFDKDKSLQYLENDVNAEEFLKYTNELIPLMFDIWIEVLPRDKTSTRFLSNGAITLLQNILAIIQSITEYTEVIEDEQKNNFSSTFKASFQKVFIQRLFNNFPYIAQQTEEHSCKRQKDFKNETNNVCLMQNIVLCHIYIWFTKVRTGKKLHDELRKDVSNSALDYLNDQIQNWRDTSTLPQLMKVLKTLFLEASEIWYKNHISLGNLLETILNAYLQSSNKEVQSNFFSLFHDIALNPTLVKLHREKTFKKFASSLTPLLLNPSIHDRTVQLLNNIVLRQTHWIKDYLLKNKDTILDNAKSIEVEGSTNVHESRLMICNLFYFMNGETYY